MVIGTPMYAIAEPDTTEKDSTEFQGNLEDSVRSFQREYFMGILHKKIYSGDSILDIADSKLKERQQLNYDLLVGNNVSVHSLYDRFGGDISFPMYLGEEVVKTGVADKIYTALAQNSIDNFSVTKLVELIQMDDTSYTNKFYKNRPSLKDSTSDPRVKTYSPVAAGKDIELSIANYFLKTSEAIVSLTGFFTSGDLVNEIADLLENILNTAPIKAVLGLVTQMTPLFVVLIIIFTAFKIPKAYLGNYSIKKMFVKLLQMLFSLGFIYAIVANPVQFVDISKKLITLGETLTAGAINETNKDDEIIYSSNLDNVIEASLWEEAVFKPWVRGTFGGVEYDNLYTTTSNKGNKWDLSSSASLAIGDISIPVSSNSDDDIKNWAALAYSCSSVYHLPALASDRETSQKNLSESADPTAESSWPKAGTLNGVDSIYDDDFRWIDASLKVGQYSTGNPSENVDSYVNTRDYKFDGVQNGAYSIWMAVLLLPLLALGVRKTMNSIMFLGNFFILLFRSIGNIIKPEDSQFEFGTSIRAMLMPLGMYLWYSILIMIAISLYRILGVSANPAIQIAYLAFAIYLCFMKPQNLKDDTKKVNKFVGDIARRSAVSYTAIKNGEMIRASEEGAIPMNTGQLAASLMKRTAGNEKNNITSDDNENSDDKKDEMREFNHDLSFQTIKKDVYDDAVEKARKKNNPDFPDAERRYKALNVALQNCKTNEEIYQTINMHRFGKKYDVNNSKGEYSYNQRMDYYILGIPYTQSASADYNNLMRNNDYKAFASLKSQRYAESRDRLKNDMNTKKTFLNNSIQNVSSIKDPKERANKLKKLEKLSKQYKRESKLNGIQNSINVFTGNELGGSIISPMLKVRIAMLILLVYLVGLCAFILFG